MNTAKAYCYQEIPSGEGVNFGFEIVCQTEIHKDTTRLKSWAITHFENWFSLRRLKRLTTFNLAKPIILECYWNNDLELILCQKRVTKDTIVRKEECVIKLTQCDYIFIPYKTIRKVPYNIPNSFEPIDLNRALNVIEHINDTYLKSRSRIIYTGMTN